LLHESLKVRFFFQTQFSCLIYQKGEKEMQGKREEKKHKEK